jgi:TetR/AcrR family transcriptional repressor of nem operon
VPRPAKFDDADLLDRSYDLLWRDGCDAVSIRDLESALGIRAPSIYRRFHSRDELIARSVDRYVERVVGARVRRHLVGSADPVAGLAEFFASALLPAPGETAPRGCLLTITAGQSASADPGVRAAVNAGLAAIDEAFHRQVRRAERQGRLLPGADPDAVSAGLLLAFEGLLVLARTGRLGLGRAAAGLFAAFFPTDAPFPTGTVPVVPIPDWTSDS